MSELRSERIGEERATRTDCNVCGGWKDGDPVRYLSVCQCGVKEREATRLNVAGQTLSVYVHPPDARVARIERLVAEDTTLRHYLKRTAPAVASSLISGVVLVAAGHTTALITSPVVALGCVLGATLAWYLYEVRPARRKAKDFPKARVL